MIQQPNISLKYQDEIERSNKSPLVDGYWIGIKDGDARARALFHRHYSYRPYTDGRKPKLFVGPGEKMVLMTVNCNALFVWRKFKSANGQKGVNCSIFRNESPILSSELILEAEQLARKRWPGERFYTYIDPRKVKSPNPGYCFKIAGWGVCGQTKANKLIILEKLPENTNAVSESPEHPSAIVPISPLRTITESTFRARPLAERKGKLPIIGDILYNPSGEIIGTVMWASKKAVRIRLRLGFLVTYSLKEYRRRLHESRGYNQPPPPVNEIVCSDALAYLRRCETASVHCISTSPPYLWQREYGQLAGEIGSETTIAEYINTLVEIFREARRVLRPDGVLWLNVGDKRVNDAKWGGATGGKKAKVAHRGDNASRRKRQSGLPAKSLVGLPWRLAFALQDDGWTLRSDCIWHKTNGLPSSATDRPKDAHEYVFLFAKLPQYWFDLEPIKESVSPATIARARGGRGNHKHADGAPGQVKHTLNQPRDADPDASVDLMRNPRTVWNIAVAHFDGDHYATFPEELARRMILSGCPPKVCPECGAPHTRITEKTFIPQPDVSTERGVKGANGQKPMYESNSWGGVPRGLTQTHTIGWQPACDCDAKTIPRPGIVLDPFMGAGTVALVAKKHGRNHMGCDLNPEYVKMAQQRISQPIQVDLFTSTGISV